jgi:DNA replication ATP-dependent helicase Dna2
LAGDTNGALENADPNKENLQAKGRDCAETASLLDQPKRAAVTPVSRLAWQDLMGVGDGDKQEDETSPTERLLWHNDTDDMVDIISPLVPRRGKKRARSSSPLSSPAGEKTRTPVVNVKKLKKALKSEQADPALDLWDRFAVGGAADSKSPLGATNPALAHLMMSSSPRPQKEGSPNHAESSLRRAISCGSHWPKRRRVESASEFRAVKDAGADAKSMMVSALLETVNGEINKTERMGEIHPGGDSPSIKKKRTPQKQVSHTPRPAISPRPSKPQSAAPSVLSPSRNGPSRNGTKRGSRTPPSDYGDDDFDDDTLLDLDVSVLSGQTEARTFSGAAATVADTDAQDAVGKCSKQATSSDDEFDDMDDDLLAAAEDIVGKADPTLTQQPAAPPPPNPIHHGGGTEDDDQFGDDFGGDFDFEAAELAATQTAGQADSSLLPVRTV